MAIGVSSTTGGTPAASASSGVSPNPSYSDGNAKTEACAIEVLQRLVVDVQSGS